MENKKVNKKVNKKPNKTGLSRHGYSIRKDQLTDSELAKIKADLTATPIVDKAYTFEAKSFAIYGENANKIYTPPHYGLEKFGPPDIDKLKSDLGTKINLKFQGKLRPQQQKIVDAYLDSAKKNGGGIITAGCGEGKTVMALYIAAYLGLKTLFVSHKDFLGNQLIERAHGNFKQNIKGFTPNARIGNLQGKKMDIINKDIVVSTLQSLSKKDYPPSIFQSFGLLIIDEAHHVGAEVYSRALLKTMFPYTLGLTATPERKDGLSYIFKYFLGDIVYQQPHRTDTSIEVKAYHYYNDDPQYSQEVHTYTGNLNTPQMTNQICECKKRNDFILDLVKDLGKKNRNVLILSDRREHLSYLKTEIETRYKLPAGLYLGGMKQSDLDVSSTKLIILGTYSMVSEGFDCPRLDSVILASPKSDVVQSIGRIMRKSPEKRSCAHLIIDIIDTFSTFPNRWYKRKKIYNKSKFAISEFDVDDNIIKTKTKKPISQINKDDVEFLDW